jgi:hypothetical protein
MGGVKDVSFGAGSAPVIKGQERASTAIFRPG